MIIQSAFHLSGVGLACAYQQVSIQERKWVQVCAFTQARNDSRKPEIPFLLIRATLEKKP